MEGSPEAKEVSDDIVDKIVELNKKGEIVKRGDGVYKTPRMEGVVDDGPIVAKGRIMPDGDWTVKTAEIKE